MGKAQGTNTWTLPTDSFALEQLTGPRLQRAELLDCTHKITEGIVYCMGNLRVLFKRNLVNMQI